MYYKKGKRKIVPDQRQSYFRGNIKMSFQLRIFSKLATMNNLQTQEMGSSCSQVLRVFFITSSEVYALVGGAGKEMDQKLEMTHCFIWYSTINRYS